jgi:maleamate amidohydrolase
MSHSSCGNSTFRGSKRQMPTGFEDHCWRDVVSPETLERYETAYRRDITIGERPALLAIDLYNLVYEGGPRPVEELYKTHRSACGSFAWDAIEPTQRLFKAARQAGLPVIYSTDDLEAKLREASRRPSSLNERSYEIKEEFKPQPGDIVIAKQRASVFYGTPIVANLNRLGVRSLIVCGESTSGCVRASVVDAVSNSYPTVVVEECTFDRHLLSHKISLFDLHHKYAGVMHLEDVEAHLAALTGKPLT